MSFLYKIINEGESYVITTRNNLKSFVKGPSRVYFPNRYTMELVPEIRAHDKEHLVIKYLNGVREVMRGPTTMFNNPLLYTDIEVKNNIYLKEDQRIRVIKTEFGTASQEYEVQGPCYYIPDINEKYYNLVRYVAKENQYISINHNSGETEIILGPTVFYGDELKHSKIEVLRSVFVERYEKIRVQKMDVLTGTIISESILEGPYYYTPKIDEKYHKLKRYIAKENQYITVNKVSGEIDTIVGPDVFYFDELYHSKVEILDSIFIKQYEKIRIQKTDADSGTIISDTIITGPCYYNPKNDEKYYKLKLINLLHDEYIHINYKNGTEEIISGPLLYYQDEIEHADITKHKSLTIESNECIVVYRSTERVCINGPCTYRPNINDNIHKFSWHGNNSSDGLVSLGKNIKKSNALQFTKLTLVPRQLYLDIPNVSTRDNAQLTICFMIFYELNNVELMLDTTTDPIADIINFHTSDVIKFVGQWTFDETKEKIGELNGLGLYENFIGEMNRRGYNISSIVVRGIVTNEKLQKMHENAIETKTALMLDHETEVEKQKILDLIADKNKARIIVENDIGLMKTENELMLKQMKHDSMIAEVEKQRELDFNNKKMIDEWDCKVLKQKNTELLNYYTELYNLDADVTKIITEDAMSKTAVGKMIRIISPGNIPNLKLGSGLDTE